MIVCHRCFVVLAFLVALEERNRTGYPPHRPQVLVGTAGNWEGVGVVQASESVFRLFCVLKLFKRGGEDG